MHHIVSDGWSMGVLVRELAALYEAFRRGRAVAAAGAAGPVRRTTRCWQREWLRGDGSEQQLAYWKRAARRGAGALELPDGPPAAGGADVRGARR